MEGAKKKIGNSNLHIKVGSQGKKGREEEARKERGKALQGPEIKTGTKTLAE